MRLLGPAHNPEPEWVLAALQKHEAALFALRRVVARRDRAQDVVQALVLAEINGVLRSLARDPLRVRGLNRDEIAKPCAERVPTGQ